ECVAELERRRDTMLEGLPGWPFVRPRGGWSMLLDVASLGLDPAEASRLLLEESPIAATSMAARGDEVAPRPARFVYPAEPRAPSTIGPSRSPTTASASTSPCRSTRKT